MNVNKAHFQWLPVAVVLGAMTSAVLTTGCGEPAPTPAPPVEEPVTEEYIQGEEAYSKQQ